MKKKIFLLGLVLLVGLASCTEKVIVQNVDSSNSELTFNFVKLFVKSEF